MTIISRPYILMWTIVGLFLTIGASFLPAYITSSPLQWHAGSAVHSLEFRCQIGAVLLVSCLGGRTTGALTQFIYVLLGLFGLKVFSDGGGIEYLQKPNFGYLLAFIPGAWVCGQLAFKKSTSQLEHLGFSCLCGLITIHVFGIIYLILFQLINWHSLGEFKLLEWAIYYSINPFVSQILLACAAASIAFVTRKIMFY
jgi:biotin transport system substrate-specific component